MHVIPWKTLSCVTAAPNPALGRGAAATLRHKEPPPSAPCDQRRSDNGTTSRQQREPSPQVPPMQHLSTGAAKPFSEGSNEKPGSAEPWWSKVLRQHKKITIYCKFMQRREVYLRV